MYANTGAGTYEKAVDMAIRTASKRAKLAGEGEKRAEWGVSTVIMNKRGNPCPKCLPFCGKILIDDVWSGGSKDAVDPETKKKYPTMSYAIECGLYHPRCKDSHKTYFPGITSAEEGWNKKELEEIGLKSKQEAKQQYAKRQVEKFERLAKYSLDDDNQKKYGAKKEQWESVQNKYSGKYLETSEDFDIMEANTNLTAVMAKRIPDASERSKVINEAIRAKRPVYAEDLRSAYGNVKKKEGCMDVCIHGSSYYTVYEHKYAIDTETLAYIISGRKEFNGDDIRLLSCDTGKTDKYGNCVAQELADKLKVRVYAPIDILNIHPDGRLTVGKEYLREEDGFKWFEPRKRDK